MKAPWITTRTKPSWAQKRDPRYDSKRWREVRSLHLQLNPLCVECLKEGIRTDCTGKGKGVVDHDKEVTKGGDFWATENHRTLCTSHHNKKSAKNRNK